MGYFTLRNTSILALVQTGIIVAGVLASGTAYKCWSVSNMNAPTSINIVSDYGWLGLLVPMTWVTATVVLQSRSRDEGVGAAIAYLSGILVVILLLVAVYYLVVGHWLRACLHDCFE